MKVTCIDLSHEGLGVCKFDNKVIFVPDLLKGEEAIIEITSEKKNYSLGKVVELLTQSERRIKPRCPHFHICGGCDLQHISFEDELEFKSNKVKNNFKKYASMDVEVESIYGEDKLNYRNKVIVYFSKNQYGFYSKNSNNIVPITECSINTESLIPICDAVAKYNQDVERVMVRTNHKNEKMVVLVTKTDKLANLKQITTELTKIPGVVSVIHNIHPKMNNLQLGQESILIFGKKRIEEEINGIFYKISPASFFQVNYDVTKKIFKEVASNLKKHSINHLIDAYCGSGTIGFQMVDSVGKVTGIELNKDAVNDANDNIVVNEKFNISFVQGKAEDELYKIKDIDAIIVDPPRAGCDYKLLDTIDEKGIKYVVYVSCDSATLARDIAYLGNKGYKMLSLKLFNMFPRTHHIESFAVLERE